MDYLSFQAQAPANMLCPAFHNTGQFLLVPRWFLLPMPVSLVHQQQM
jgi:hypothetical protein